MGALRVGGLTPLSACDYPGHLAAVVFCQGCPWRCGYCHNPHLLPRRAAHELEWRDVLAFLERRRGLLDAVVYSGGEPTLQGGLPGAMRTARELGFKIGLHTAGIAPRLLAAALRHADWVGFDVKAPFDDYQRVTGIRDSGRAARESALLVLASGVEYEFRTTVHGALLPALALERIGHGLAALGVQRYVLQQFRPAGCSAPDLAGTVEPDYPGPALIRRLAGLFPLFSIRRAGQVPEPML